MSFLYMNVSEHQSCECLFFFLDCPEGDVCQWEEDHTQSSKSYLIVPQPVSAKSLRLQNVIAINQDRHVVAVYGIKGNNLLLWTLYTFFY